MQTKSFYGETLEEALAFAKQELGDPVIVKYEQKSGKGLFRRPMYEVVASLDSAKGKPKSTGFSVVDEPGAGGFLVNEQPKPAPKRRTPRPGKVEVQMDYEMIEQAEANTEKPQESVEQGVAQAEAAVSPEDIQQQLNDLRDLVGRTLRAAEMPNQGRRIQTPDNKHADNWFYHFADRMAERGLDEEVIDLVARMALKRLTPAQTQNPQLLNDFAQQFVAYLLKDCGKKLASEGIQERIALIGPTGVGKTTTIAKIAADKMIKQGKDVALITIDIYRIAAAEQLMVYGEIMNLPVEVAQTPDQLKTALDKHKNKDVVLIDTAGRSANDAMAIEDMARFFTPQMGIDINLVLSATTRERELYRACAKFGQINIDNIIFTKLDECEDYGALLNFYMRKKIPISFLTNGQRVPEDFMPAEPEQTAKLIVGA